MVVIIGLVGLLEQSIFSRVRCALVVLLFLHLMQSFNNYYLLYVHHHHHDHDQQHYCKNHVASSSIGSSWSGCVQDSPKTNNWLLIIPSVQGGWIDPDTPADKRTIMSYSDKTLRKQARNNNNNNNNNNHNNENNIGNSNDIIYKQYDLVMSDEFNVEQRSFKDGSDPMWTALDKSDDDQTSSGKKSLQFYNSSMITTKGGNLVISTTTEDTRWKGFDPYTKKYTTMSRHFKSGMLQSWNKFCYTGGILEIDLQFPGRHDVGGLWPAVWLLGNLGRATYETSTNLMWPWSYEKCDRELQYAQDVSGCSVTSHYSLHPQQGRGATEIDIVEVMSGPSTPLPYVKNHVKRPYNSMTLQIAPGIPTSKRRPFSGTLPEWGFHWYKNLSYGTNVSINPFFYGTYLAPTKAQEPVKRSKQESYQADAISALSSMDKSFYEKMHTFRLEWQPGDKGYLHWYMDGKFQFGVEADALKEEGSVIPNEPSSVILNTAISTSWGFPSTPWGCNNFDCKAADGQCGFSPGFCRMLPAQFLVDHIRIYQDKNNSKHTLTCNPKDYPTKKYILGHEYRYKTANKDHALTEVAQGGGKCVRNSDCSGAAGGSREVAGTCSGLSGCVCSKHWTGPHCMSPNHFDDGVDWEDDSSDLSVLYPHIPITFIAVLATLLLITLWANFGWSFFGGSGNNSNNSNNSRFNNGNRYEAIK